MEFIQYLQEIFSERRKQPQSDLISALLEAEEDGQKLSQGELFADVTVLLVAGMRRRPTLLATGCSRWETPLRLRR